MNIYSLERIESDDFGYDEMYGCVVIAVDEQEARDYAATHAGDEGKYAWLSTRVVARNIGRASDRAELELVCRDFHAG